MIIDRVADYATVLADIREIQKVAQGRLSETIICIRIETDDIR